MTKVDEVKAIDLAAFVSQYAGQPADKSGKWLFFYSPFREERTPSFGVNTQRNTWADFGQSEDVRGDIYDFVCFLHMGRKMLNHDDWREAHQIITGESGSKPLPKVKDTRRMDLAEGDSAADKRVNLEHVLKCAEKADPYAYHYFEERHISRESVASHKIGVDFERPWGYEFADGTSAFFKTRRFVIPYMTGNSVRKLAERRDDFAAKMEILRLQDEDPELFECVLTDIAHRSHGKYTPLSIPQDVLMDKLFGRKYLRPGSGNFVYNAERIVRVEDGQIVMHNNKPVLHCLRYLLVTEGEINALTAEDAGYPCVAAKFQFPVHPYTKVIYVADRDDSGAGMSYAEHTTSTIPNAQIIMPPVGFNDMNDLERAGKLNKWLESHGIEPLWERKFMGSI